jgi:hypothetical protein
MIIKIFYFLMILLNVVFFIISVKKKTSNKWFNFIAIVFMIIMYFLIHWENL